MSTSSVVCSAHIPVVLVTCRPTCTVQCTVLMNGMCVMSPTNEVDIRRVGGMIRNGTESKFPDLSFPDVCECNLVMHRAGLQFLPTCAIAFARSSAHSTWRRQKKDVHYRNESKKNTRISVKTWHGVLECFVCLLYMPS